MLAAFDRRGDLRRHRAALADSGIQGTDLHLGFYAPMARWVAKHWGDRLHIDWGGVENHGAAPRPAVPAGAGEARRPALDHADLTARQWIDRCRGPDGDRRRVRGAPLRLGRVARAPAGHAARRVGPPARAARRRRHAVADARARRGRHGALADGPAPLGPTRSAARHPHAAGLDPAGRHAGGPRVPRARARGDGHARPRARRVRRRRRARRHARRLRRGSRVRGDRLAAGVADAPGGRPRVADAPEPGSDRLRPDRHDAEVDGGRLQRVRQLAGRRGWLGVRPRPGHEPRAASGRTRSPSTRTSWGTATRRGSRRARGGSTRSSGLARATRTRSH